MRASMRAVTSCWIVPAIPCGTTSTRSKITPPSSARQYSVWRATLSCSQVNVTLPTIGPDKRLMPPSSTITSPSTERPIESVSGEMLPFEKAKSPPANAANAPAMTKADPLHARCTSMPIASARSGESRTARIA